MPLPLWIRTPDALEMLVRELEGAACFSRPACGKKDFT